MCFGSPEIDTSYQDYEIAESERAREEEDQRQADIDAGMREIAAIFEGGSIVNTESPDYDGFYSSSNQYLEGEGDQVPMTTYEGMQPILDQREQAQMDYYLPQLEDQKVSAEEDLVFALARAGLLDSTTAGERQADLSQEYALREGSLLADIASDIANEEAKMNNERASIEAGLQSTGDATQATNQALASYGTFAADQPTLDPLGDLFFGITEGIGAAKNAEEVANVQRISAPSPLSTSNAGRTVG